MAFSSPVFLFYFLPLALFVNYLLPKRFQNSGILTLSLLYYFWGEPKFWWIMVLYWFLNYFLALLMQHWNQKLILTVGLFLNIFGLVIFKYLDFLIASINGAFGFNLTLLSIPLPAGISFFTFHCLSYLVDVYRKEKAPERNIVALGVYISFFPQLIAGPIIRFKEIADQIHKRTATYIQFKEGIYRFIIGMAKKVIVADTVAKLADLAFDGLKYGPMSPSVLWLGSFAYTLQIYFDFSGYSDMAIGLAKLFGINFPENFNRPYRSLSIQEFWRRWHISLSSWFRDYLYIPLGGNRGSATRTYLNLFIVFGLCGIWHGASWTFLFWGLYHGFFLMIERLGLLNILNKFPSILRSIYVLFVVNIGWIYFRADNFELANSFLKSMFDFTSSVNISISSVLNTEELIIMMTGGIIALSPTLKVDLHSIDLKFLKPVGHLLLLILSLFFMASTTHSPFIYFRF